MAQSHKTYSLEVHVNSYVSSKLDTLELISRKDYHEESAIPDYLKEALKGRAKTQNKTNFGKPDFSITKYTQAPVIIENKLGIKKLITETKDGHGATSVLQNEKLNKINQMFIITLIDKIIKSKYSYNNKATKIELKNTLINLPIKNQQPHYAIMETLISAIQKLVIKDVVLYADKKIAATKSVAYV